MRRLLGLLTSPDGSLSASKLCYLLFVGVITQHMLRAMPADAVMWLVYGATVGGVDVAKKALNLHYRTGSQPAQNYGAMPYPMPTEGPR